MLGAPILLAATFGRWVCLGGATFSFRGLGLALAAAGDAIRLFIGLFLCSALSLHQLDDGCLSRRKSSRPQTA
jgi:hypothetical protein